jgi:hypothetical protein
LLANLVKEQTVTETTSRESVPITPGPSPFRLHPPRSLTTAVEPPRLMEGATYAAHLHNLTQLGIDALMARTNAELASSSAARARQLSDQAMQAVEQMAQGLAAQDFGAEHIANANILGELFAIHQVHAYNAALAAQSSLHASDQVDRACRTAVAAFRRDHGQLAEAHAVAKFPAKSREAYQPL